MNPRERELLQGMVNCYHTCHADFEGTVGMVGSARGLSPDEVKEILTRLKKAGGGEYEALRSRLPDEFPL
jgi:hypothetical protein